LSESYEEFPKRPPREGLFGAISAGFFFLLVGAIFVITPSLFERIFDFFGNFEVVSVPNTGISLLAPTRPWAHSIVYRATEQFCFAFGFFQIVILALRFIARSPVGKKAETSGNVVFWLGAGYLISLFLTQTTTWEDWFAFWSAIIILLGSTLIVRAIILAAASTRRVA